MYTVYMKIISFVLDIGCKRFHNNKLSFYYFMIVSKW